MVAQLTEYSKLLHHSSPSKLCEWRYMTCTIPRKRAPEEADMPTSSYWPLPRSELYRWPGGGGGGGGAPKTQKRKNPKNAADTMSEAALSNRVKVMERAAGGCVSSNALKLAMCKRKNGFRTPNVSTAGARRPGPTSATLRSNLVIHSRVNRTMCLCCGALAMRFVTSAG